MGAHPPCAWTADTCTLCSCTLQLLSSSGQEGKQTRPCTSDVKQRGCHWCGRHYIGARPGRTVGGRFPGVDAAPGEDKLLGARAAHHPRQALRAARPGPQSWVGFYMWWLFQPALDGYK